MFRGIYHISLDTKGRLSVPAKVRAQFEEESDGVLILTAELENQLLLYTLPEWQKVEEKLVKLPSFDPQIRRLKRLYMGNAAECELDSTGRILIPPPLRQRPGLGGEQPRLQKVPGSDRPQGLDIEGTAGGERV